MTGSLCYSGAWHLFNYYDADITSITVDNHGLQTDNLPEYEIQLRYVTPAHQYLMGSVLSPERHQSLLTQAQRVGAHIIEDGYDAAFTYGENPLPALKIMDCHNRVIYTGAFSKTLRPDARLGYLICPDELLPAVQNMKTPNNNSSQWLLQQFLVELMQNQVFYTHLSRLVCSYAARLALLRDGLPTLFPEEETAGATTNLHLSLHTVRYTEFITRLQQSCLLVGIRFDAPPDIEDGSEATWRKENSGAVMFSGSSGLQTQQINRVLTVLEQALAQS